MVVRTRSTQVQIGERRKPHPAGRPGFLRVDSVHQGDLDGEKGLYEINLVDEVTQYEFVAAVEGISERFLVPALEGSIEAFPFIIRGFHADNGSEYINHRVAALLRKLHIEESKQPTVLERKSDIAGALARPILDVARHCPACTGSEVGGSQWARRPPDAGRIPAW